MDRASPDAHCASLQRVSLDRRQPKAAALAKTARARVLATLGNRCGRIPNAAATKPRLLPRSHPRRPLDRAAVTILAPSKAPRQCKTNPDWRRPRAETAPRHSSRLDRRLQSDAPRHRGPSRAQRRALPHWARVQGAIAASLHFRAPTPQPCVRKSPDLYAAPGFAGGWPRQRPASAPRPGRLARARRHGGPPCRAM